MSQNGGRGYFVYVPIAPTHPPRFSSLSHLRLRIHGLNMRCLVIEDYTPLRNSVQEHLVENGYIVDSSPTGDEGLWFARNHPYDVIILDIMLPKINGLDILKKLREIQDKTPVLIISSRDSVANRVEGLNAGADDYLVKPFDLSELVARVRALSRRLYAKETSVVKIGDLEIDFIHKSVTRSGREIHFTRREYNLLEYLAHRSGQPVSRSEIWDHVYEDQSGGNSNAVDVYIGYLRKKLNDGGLPDLIHTRRGYGYVLGNPP